MKHTKEPWAMSMNFMDKVSIRGNHGVMIAWCAYFDNGLEKEKANAKRIIACVNACKGITNEALEAGVVCGSITCDSFANIKVREEDEEITKLDNK